MDFYISKEEVVKSLNLTLGVVEKRQTLPILSNVLFEVDQSSLKLTATDLESEISTTSTVSNYKSGGKTTAPARKLSDLCRLLPNMTEIHFFLDGENLKIETESGKYNLSTLPSEDFPVFEIEETQSQINISSQNLKTLISKTAFAMGNQDWRHYLNGLFLLIDDKTITTVATDAHRLALATSSLNEAVSDSTNGIVPRKSINEIGKLVGDGSENDVIKLGQTSIAANDFLSSSCLRGLFGSLLFTNLFACAIARLKLVMSISTSSCLGLEFFAFFLASFLDLLGFGRSLPSILWPRGARWVRFVLILLVLQPEFFLLFIYISTFHFIQ